jgi:hypothetical protein
MRIFTWAVAALLLFGSQANADIRITEVASWGSSNSPYTADWFELTNFGPASVDITGWKMDDGSNSFASAVAFGTEVTSIGSGESVIFLETSPANYLGRVGQFNNVWFGTSTSGLKIGSYNGSGVGLSTGGDAVNIYNASGSLMASVSFGTASTTPLRSFDNSLGLNNQLISSLSTVGVNNAFLSFDGLETGSPGAVPEPSALGLLAVAGVVAGGFRRKRS